MKVLLQGVANQKRPNTMIFVKEKIDVLYNTPEKKGKDVKNQLILQNKL